MKILVFLVTLVVGCSAEKQDLSGKVITVPQGPREKEDQVTATFESWNTTSTATVCLRFFTDDEDKLFTLFSLASPTVVIYNNIFVLNSNSEGQPEIVVHDTGVSFKGFSYEWNRWNSICATWDANKGIAQVWLNGRPSVRKLIKLGAPLNADAVFSLGQKREYGQANKQYYFEGSLTDLHMWDSVISPQEIQAYMKAVINNPGNVLNWKQLEFTTKGFVFVEDKSLFDERGEKQSG